MFDMILFPILWSLLQTVTHTPITQWNPLTLQGAGLFHIAMGAVLGIAAFGRTQEKLNGANNGGAQTPATGFTPGLTTTSQPSTGFGAAPGGFSTPATTTGGFGSSAGFGTTTPSTPAPAVTSGFGGKAAPAPQIDPVL
jgi:hypothetical protein